MSRFTGAPSRRLASNWSRHILYVDRAVVVLNKPSGLICQTDHAGDSIQDLSKLTTFRECLNSVQANLSLSSTPYPVHRLDKGTTGTLLLATTLQSAQGLSQQFHQRTIEKNYLALVRGGEKSFPVKSGVIDTPLHYYDGRVSIESPRRAKPSFTEWSVVASSPIAPLSLLRLRLLTGHKHQLRVHMSQCLKAPILGDDLYSNTEPSKDIIGLTEIPPNRMYLHAHETSFFKYRLTKPHKRFRLGVCAPVPSDFLRICADTQIDVKSLCVKGGLFVDGEPVEDGKVSAVDGYWFKNDAK